MSPHIADAFVIPGKAHLNDSNVEGWRTTLNNGFWNGFGFVYRITTDTEASDHVLMLEEASPELTATGPFGASRIPAAQVTAVPAVAVHIRYRAVLVNQDGSRRIAAGTAVSKVVATGKSDLDGVFASAVETMYEEIAAKPFGHATTPTPSHAPDAPPVGPGVQL